MPNPGKRKGTVFESCIATYLHAEWSEHIERMPLSGSSDRGDIANFSVGAKRVAIECKNVQRMELAEWVAEAQREAQNYNALAGVVIHKRKGRGRPGDQYVTLTLRDFLDILHAAAS